MIKRVLMASAVLAMSAALAHAQEVKIGLVAPFTGIGAELGHGVGVDGIRTVRTAVATLIRGQHVIARVGQCPDLVSPGKCQLRKAVAEHHHR